MRWLPHHPTTIDHLMNQWILIDQRQYPQYSTSFGEQCLLSGICYIELAQSARIKPEGQYCHLRSETHLRGMSGLDQGTSWINAIWVASRKCRHLEYTNLTQHPSQVIYIRWAHSHQVKTEELNQNYMHMLWVWEWKPLYIENALEACCCSMLAACNYHLCEL